MLISMKSILLTLILLIAPLCQGQILSIVADEWYPMNGTPNSARPGYMIELAKTIFSQHGIEVQYHTIPWNRAIEQTKEGKYNCVVGAYKSDARDFIYPKASWGLDVARFYVLKHDSWEFSGNIDSLRFRKLGVIEGYKYQDELDHYINTAKSMYVQSLKGNQALEKNIKKLLAKRIDTTIESENVFNAKIKEMGLEQHFQSAGHISPASKMYLACSPNHPNSQKYVDMVDAAMPKLRQSGKLEAILNRYGLKDWQ